MKMRFLLVSLASLALAGSAQAAMIAGWDFSQWAGEGALITNGTTGATQDTLPANYSDFDPTKGAGAESAAFGTLYFDGSFGSTNVDENAYPPDFYPVTGSLSSNLNAPLNGVPVGDVPFDTLSVLMDEGQDFQEQLSMTATDLLDVVFAVDVTSLGNPGTDWGISFGAKTLTGNESQITLSFSTDGSMYVSVGDVNIDGADKLYSVNLSSDVTDVAYVKLGFDPSSLTGGQPVIDNVAIAATIVPEPGTFAMLALGLIGLHIAGRRRA